MSHHKPRTGWILTGNWSLASSRLQGYRVHSYLVQQGYESEIIAIDFGKYEKGYSLTFFSILRKILHSHIDIIIFQKPGWMMFKMSEILRLRGIRTIAIQCDPFPGSYDQYFDATVVTTEELKQQLDIAEAYVIDDVLEVPPGTYKQSYVAQSSHLRVVWVGQGTGAGGRVFIEPFIDQLSRHPKLSDIVEFVTISRGSWATHEWSLDSVYTLICNCDIAIIPLPEDSWVNAKSSNRLTMLMALGMPTIVSPIPSYLRIINPGENSLLACTPDEYAEAINSYCDAGKRERIGKAGRETAIKQFSPETLGAEWIKVLEMVCKTPQTKPSSNMLTKFMSNLLQVSLFI